MHQHSLTSFGAKFGFISDIGAMLEAEGGSDTTTFTTSEYELGYGHWFSVPVRRPPLRTLDPTQLRHLKEHYLTVDELDSLDHPLLQAMGNKVQVWLRCRADKTFYHCEEYRKRIKDAKRLNHLASINQQIDQYAHISASRHDSEMVDASFYVSIQFFCVHKFNDINRMLLYSSYLRVQEHDGLLEYKGIKNTGFQDVRVLSHLCGRAPGHGNKTYILDDETTTEERIRHSLGAARGPRAARG